MGGAGGRFGLMTKLKCCVQSVSTFSTEMLLELLSSQEKISKLQLIGNALWQVDKNVLSTCLNKMGVVQLLGCLHSSQVKLMFKEMEEKTNIVELKIRGTDLRCVPARLLTRCVNRMERVSLVGCNLSDEQVRALLLEMQNGTCLKELDIGGNELGFNINSERDVTDMSCRRYARN